MAAPSAAGKKVLRVGLLTPVRTLDPLKYSDSVSRLAIVQVFETPYAQPPRLGDPLRPRLFDGPLVAESPGVLSAGLAAGATFSDGTPVTAARVADWLARVGVVATQAKVEAKGERVVFTLAAPNPRFDLSLTTGQCAVVLEKGADLLGSGAFVPAPGTSLERLRLVKNPRYRRPVAIDEVSFDVYPPDADGRPGALLQALEAGQVDFTTMVSRDDSASLQGVRKALRPANATAILHLNTTRGALADRRVRQAICAAVDRRALTELCYSNALAFVAGSLLPPGMGATTDRLACDPARARALLAAAGVSTPLRLELVVIWAPRPYLPKPGPVAALITKQLAEVGIQLTVTQPHDSEAYVQRKDRGDYDLVLAGWIADTPDPAEFLDANLRSDRIPRPGRKGVAGSNLSRLADPALDGALRSYREDPQAAKLEGVLARVADEAPLLALMYGPTIVLSSFRLQNVEVSLLGLADFSTFDLA